MKSTHVYAITNRMFSEKRTVGESTLLLLVLLSVSGAMVNAHQDIQDIICSGVKRTHLVYGLRNCCANVCVCVLLNMKIKTSCITEWLSSVANFKLN